MEEKKKVKSISNDAEDAVEATVAKEKKKLVIDDFDDYKPSSGRLKHIVWFLLGIVATIALFSFLGAGKKSFIGGGSINTAISNVSAATVLVENYNGNNQSIAGTGFVYKLNKGRAYILTNYHNVSGSTSLRVTFSNNTRADATFVGGDHYYDIAVISVPSKYAKKVATIGSSKDAKVGDSVFTVGSPYGSNYNGTVTSGILSGKNRTVMVSETKGYMVKLLQTDVAMDEGNSGGPLCNSRGEVIGMNSLKLSKEKLVGTNFAMPIEDVMKKVGSFEKGSKTAKPYIGISMVNLNDSDSMAYYGLSNKINTALTKGVVVETVKTNSPAAGKLIVTDIITKVDGISVDTISSFKYELYKHAPGDQIVLTIERSRVTHDVTIVLGTS